jgi:hypothetical protein
MFGFQARGYSPQSTEQRENLIELAGLLAGW